MSGMSLLARENIIISVIEQTGRSREKVAGEVDRQLGNHVDFISDGPVRDVAERLAYYTDAGTYDQWREAEAERLGVRVETLDTLVEKERVKLAPRDKATGRERRKAVARHAGMLLHRGVDVITTYELCRAWNSTECHPPLPTEELQRVLDYVAEREMKRTRAA